MNDQTIPGSFGGDNGKINAQTKLECKICWYVYDPLIGDDYWQIPKGTSFTDLPDHWACPECDGKKVDFMVLS